MTSRPQRTESSTSLSISALRPTARTGTRADEASLRDGLLFLEAIMKLGRFILIACAFLVIAGCVVEPFGRGGRGDYYGGGYSDRGGYGGDQIGRASCRERV